MNNFNGQRLKLARIYRNMTASELAEKLGVTRQTILQYEKNDINPKLEMEFKIITTLRFPKDFFYKDDLDKLLIENTFFRALSTTKKIDLQTQEEKTKIIVYIYEFLSNYFNYPELNLPEIDVNIDLENKNNIEDIVMKVRNYWGLGEHPIENMVNLLENKGIIVSTLNINNKKIDAFTQVHKINNIDKYCVILSNDKQSVARRNFDAAHELGHIILHSNIEKLEELSSEEQRKLEEQANSFAAAFLLPKNEFFNDLNQPLNLEYYKELKKKWKVSIAAMVMRARQLGRINNSQYIELVKTMNYRKWRTREPLDNQWKLQQTILFKKSIEMLKNNKILSGSQFVYEIGKCGIPMYAEDLEELLDLEKGTLSDYDSINNNDVILQFKSERNVNNERYKENG